MPKKEVNTGVAHPGSCSQSFSLSEGGGEPRNRWGKYKERNDEWP